MLKTLARTPARLALPVVLLAAGAAAASAQQPQPTEPQQQREHVVRRGDTLWDLARTYLSNPFSWPQIFEANRNVVKDPHWIYPAERLIIPPLLQQQAQAQPLPLAEPIGTEVAGEPAPFVNAPADQAAEPLQQPTLISTVDLRRPAVSAAEHRRAPWIGAPLQAGGARITRKVDPAAQDDRLYSILLPNERVFVAAPGVGAGDSLLVVRPGRHVGGWGQIIEPLAILHVETVLGGQAQARVVSQFGEARVGDLVLPLGAEPQVPTGEALDVTGGPTGRLLAFVVEQPLVGTTDVGFVSLGRAEGLGIGDELGVYVPADATGPAVHVGVVRVIRVADRTATVRVVGASSLALRDGLPVTLIRRMP